MKLRKNIKSISLVTIVINLLSIVFLPLAVYCQESNGDIIIEISCNTAIGSDRENNLKNRGSGKEEEHCDDCTDSSIILESSNANSRNLEIAIDVSSVYGYLDKLSMGEYNRSCLLPTATIFTGHGNRSTLLKICQLRC